MVMPKVVICPICGKGTLLRVQDGSFLKEYPIRVHCMNCRALLKGVYIMQSNMLPNGFHMLNAQIVDVDADPDTHCMKNADFVAEISGELPCRKVYRFDASLVNLPSTPFMHAVEQLDSLMVDRIDRFKSFTQNMDDWKKWKGIAFQLLSEDSSNEYLAKALKNKMGTVDYECSNWLKSLHCIQETVRDQTQHLFINPDQTQLITDILHSLSSMDNDLIHTFIERIGGVRELVLAYRKSIEIFSAFMSIYPSVLPAETFMRFPQQDDAHFGIATCSFTDIKTFYQDAYESLLSLVYIPVCLDNIIEHGNYLFFDENYNRLFNQNCYRNDPDHFHTYLKLDKGMKAEMLNTGRIFQNFINLPVNKDLRNGIGHNSIKYDAINQIIHVYDRRDSSRVILSLSLIEMAMDCIGLVRTSVVISEILLCLMRRELHTLGIHSIVHPRYYERELGLNDKCPCGTGLKYKKCCRNDIESIHRTLK